MFEKTKGDLIVKINSGTIARTFVIAFMFLLLWQLRDLVLVILSAIVIASATEPATKFLMKYRFNRLASVILTYVTVSTLFFASIYFILPPVLGDLSSFLSTVPDYVSSSEQIKQVANGEISDTAGKLSTLSDDLGVSQNAFSGLVEKFNGKDSSQIAGLSSIVDIINNVKDALSNVSSSFTGILSLIFGGVFSFIIIVVLSFYFAVQEDGISNFLRVIIPDKHEEYVISLWTRTRNKIGFWMQGQILLALLVGVLTYLGLTILGVKNALLFALLAAVFEIIPLFGPILSALLPTVSAFVDSGLTSALLVIGLFVIIQQFENHLIYPLVVKKIVGVPPIFVVISLIAGIKIAGFLGILLAIPVAAALTEYFIDIGKRKHGLISVDSNQKSLDLS